MVKSLLIIIHNGRTKIEHNAERFPGSVSSIDAIFYSATSPQETHAPLPGRFIVSGLNGRFNRSIGAITSILSPAGLLNPPKPLGTVAVVVCSEAAGRIISSGGTSCTSSPPSSSPASRPPRGGELEKQE